MEIILKKEIFQKRMRYFYILRFRYWKSNEIIVIFSINFRNLIRKKKQCLMKRFNR